MRQRHTNTFTGVINQDVDPLLLGPGDYIDALNIIHGPSGTQGAVENPLGTTSVTFDALRNGVKKVTGTVEDKQRQYLYYFIYNETSVSNNQIARWEPRNQRINELCRGSALNFEADLRIQGAVVDGKYLYWTDGRVIDNELQGNEPRKINVDKAVRYARQLNSIIYADINNPNVFANGNEYFFRIRDETFAEVYTTTFTADGTYVGDIKGGLEWLISEIQGESPGLADYLYVELCGECRINVQGANEAYTVELVADNDDLILIPDDWYPNDLETYHISLVKQPPTCAPVATYVKVPGTSINNVSRGCYQFRARFVYDDGEKSAWGPISQVALNTNIDGTPNESLNAIEIDFTDERLSDVSWMAILRGVELAVRDGNDGLWKMIKEIDICDLGIVTNKYTWLNDAVYATIPSDDPSQGNPSLQVLKLFDEVPLIAGSLETTSGVNSDQRLFLGNLKEGYECIECTEVDVTYEDYAEDDCLTTITGTVQVYEDDETTPIDPDFRDYALGGFVVYLAGTNYYAISNNPADGTGDGSFEIKNVPKGRYILRVAAPYCRYDDDNGSRHNLKNALEWQKTSAPLIDCAGSVASTGNRFERIIDMTGLVGNVFDLDTEVGFGEIKVHNGYWDAAGGMIEMYFFDNNGETATGADREGAIMVERLYVGIDTGSSTYGETDHNGYFWVFKPNGTGTSAFYDFPGLGFYQYANAPLSGDMSTVFTDAFVLNAEVANNPTDPKGVNGGSTMVFIFNSRDTWTTTNLRTLTGTITDTNGDPVSGVLLSFEHNGRQEYSAYDGTYSIAMYPRNNGTDPLARVNTLVATYPNDVCADYPADPVRIIVNVSPWADDPNNDFQFGFAGGQAVETRVLKRGANYSIGFVYEDDAARTCGVTFVKDIHIPFFTEDSSFAKLIPQLSVYHQPPVYAKRYKVVRTKNTTHRSYFQWVTDEVRFGVVTSPSQDPVFTTYGASNWTHLFIRVNARDIRGTDQALLLFFQEAREGYTAQIGDRVRFVTDADNNVINPGSILELDVVGRFIEDENYYVVVPRINFTSEPEAGWLFEFYTPKGVDELFYYETGQCYDVVNPGESNRGHAAPIQIQDYSIGQPAILNVEGGDTYWRQKLFNTVGGDGVTIDLENKTMTAYHQDPCEDIGRAFAIVDNDEVWRYNRIRFSGVYVPGSGVNGLSSFGSLDYQDLNRQFGPINAMAYVSNILLAICQNKSQSLYVGRGRVLDLRGQESVGRSDQVVSVANESVADAGTTHPESVVINHGRVYWWDLNRGRMWRYSQAGIEPIDAGLYEMFQETSIERKNLTQDADFCPAGYDRLNNLYIITFGAGTYSSGDDRIPIAGKTYAYSEPANGWRTRFSFLPSHYGMVSNELVSFPSTCVLWRHNKNTTRNSFYGTAYLSEIQYPANAIPQAVKDWHCVTVRTDNLWAMPTITVPANQNYKSGMSSRLKANKFTTYEGDLCADFLRDMNDTSAVFVAITNPTTRAATALLQGRPLKGHVLIQTLQSAGTAGAAFKLWHVITEFSISHKTGV